jgi:hypothetical protein
MRREGGCDSRLCSGGGKGRDGCRGGSGNHVLRLLVVLR